MKKIYLFVSATVIFVFLLFLGCTKEDATVKDIQGKSLGGVLSEFEYKETFFVISEGAPFKTKTHNSANYCTVLARQDSKSFSLVSCHYIDDNGVAITQHFDLQGAPLATFYAIDGKLVDIDLSLDESVDYVFTPLTKARREGESYFACVKRTYAWAKETLENSDWQIVCDAPVLETACYASEVSFSILSCIGKE